MLELRLMLSLVTWLVLTGTVEVNKQKDKVTTQTQTTPSQQSYGDCKPWPECEIDLIEQQGG